MIWMLMEVTDDANEAALFSEWFMTARAARTVCNRMNREHGSTVWKVVKFVQAAR